MAPAANPRSFSGEFVFVNHDNSRGASFKERKTSIRSHLSGDYRVWLSKHRSKRLLNTGQPPRPRSPNIPSVVLNKSWANARAEKAAATRRRKALARTPKERKPGSQDSSSSLSPVAEPQSHADLSSTPESRVHSPRSYRIHPVLAPRTTRHPQTTHTMVQRTNNSASDNVPMMIRPVALPPAMPYNIFPVGKHEGVAQGWQYFTGVISPSLLRRPGQANVDAGFLQQTLPHILNDKMLFSVYMAASMINLLRHQVFQPSDRWRQQRFQLRAVQELQKCLNSQDAAVALSDAVVITIVTLAIIEYFAGSYEALRTHVTGLKKIVELKGGFDKFGWSGFVKLRIISLFCFWAHLEARAQWRGKIFADEHRKWQSAPLELDREEQPLGLPAGFADMSRRHYLRPDLLALTRVLKLDQEQSRKYDAELVTGRENLLQSVDDLGMNGVVCNEIMWKGHFRFAEYLVATSLLQYIISRMLITKPPGAMPMLGILMTSVQMYCWKLQSALSNGAESQAGARIDTTERALEACRRPAPIAKP